MGLIRTLLYLIIGVIAWYAIRNYLRKQQRQSAQREQQRSQVSSKIVKCGHCAVHLPEMEAIAYKEQWFCSPAHMERWLEQHKGQDL
jgi:uncharacterized protein